MQSTKYISSLHLLFLLLPIQGQTLPNDNQFVCPQGFHAPNVKDPGEDVSRVHPGHFDYVAAIGDSITAGFAARTLPLEFRGQSFSGGSEPVTLQWFLQHYKHNITGGSVGTHLPVVADAPDPFVFSKNDHLNVAVSSASSGFYPKMVDRLKNQTKELPDGWMVITIFLGENDLCNTGTRNCGTPQQQQVTIDEFRKNMNELLSELIAWRKKLYINLFQLFWVGSIAQQESRSWRCEAQEKKLFHACPCLFTGNVTENVAKLDHVGDQLNQILEELAEQYDRIRPDIGVNVIRAFNRVAIPDLSYMSELDCFHPSFKTHRLAAKAVWNSMLRPSQPTPVDDEEAYTPVCANASSRVMTWKDQRNSSFGRKESTSGVTLK